MDRVGHVEHRRRRVQRDGIATVAQVNAHEARHGPELVAEPVETLVVENGDR